MILPRLIEAFTKHPHANVGIITGEISGVLVVDSDDPEGFDSFCKVIGGELPELPIVKTGKGCHFYGGGPPPPGWLGSTSRRMLSTASSITSPAQSGVWRPSTTDTPISRNGTRHLKLGGATSEPSFGRHR